MVLKLPSYVPRMENENGILKNQDSLPIDEWRISNIKLAKRMPRVKDLKVNRRELLSLGDIGSSALGAEASQEAFITFPMLTLQRGIYIHNPVASVCATK